MRGLRGIFHGQLRFCSCRLKRHSPSGNPETEAKPLRTLHPTRRCQLAKPLSIPRVVSDGSDERTTADVCKCIRLFWGFEGKLVMLLITIGRSLPTLLRPTSASHSTLTIHAGCTWLGAASPWRFLDYLFGCSRHCQQAPNIRPSFHPMPTCRPFSRLTEVCSSNPRSTGRRNAHLSNDLELVAKGV